MGERATKLSSSQRQRIVIARAVIKDAPILILDEQTAAFDPETESNLVVVLVAGRRDGRLGVIAHCLSTIWRADRICFMNEGRIVEFGSHEQLMSLTNVAYRTFLELQVGVAA